MDDARLMGQLERIAELAGQQGRRLRHHRSDVIQQGPQGGPFNELGDDEAPFVVGPRVVEDPQDVGVLQRLNRTGLACKAGPILVRRTQVRVQELDGHLAPQGHVSTEVDGGHAALTDLFEHFVLVEDGSDHRAILREALSDEEFQYGKVRRRHVQTTGFIGRNPLKILNFNRLRLPKGQGAAVGAKIEQ